VKKKYGDSVTYEEDPLAHVKTEFGFDVLEVAQGRYAPDSYTTLLVSGFQSRFWNKPFRKPTAWVSRAFSLTRTRCSVLPVMTCGASPELRAEFLELYGERSGSA
jgi:hypothetical protein